MHPKKTKSITPSLADIDQQPVEVSGRTLPRAIVNARAAARHPMNCLDLRNSSKRVLHAILAFYNLKTKEAIFPFRKALALEADNMGESTLRHHLSILEEKGYIVRLPQRHKPRTAGADWGKFSVTPIQLTQKALILVGLDRLIHKTTTLESSDGKKKREHTKEKKQSSVKNTIPGTSNSKPQDPVDRATKLPKDLLPLLDRGMTRQQIFKLMGKATRQGKRLSSVYSFRAGRIATLDLQGNDAYSYLSSLIDENVDFDYLARETQKANEVADKDARAKELLATLDHRYDGYLVEINGQAVGTLRVSSANPAETWIESAAGDWVRPMNLSVARSLLSKQYRFIPAQVYG